MVRIFVVYEGEVDPERYARHVEICRRVPGLAAFRHGPVFGSPHGEPELRHYAEFEFADMQAFREAAATPEMRATGADAAEMGIPHRVYFVDLAS